MQPCPFLAQYASRTVYRACGREEPDKFWNFPLQVDMCMLFNSTFSLSVVWLSSNSTPKSP